MKRCIKEQEYFSQRRFFGCILLFLSIGGIIVFNLNGWNNTIFYLSFGWGLGMLL
jgi:hypothetical protein